eukprot:5440480-Pleurochrysis_carterae.AAC.1
MRDVLLLLKDDAVLVDGDVHVQQVRDGPLVLHVPSSSQIRSEVVVKGSWAVVRVQREQIIDIAPQDETLVDPGDGACEREEGALPTSAGLRHAVDWLFNAAHTRAAIGTKGGVTRWRMTVDYLPVQKFAL